MIQIKPRLTWWTSCFFLKFTKGFSCFLRSLPEQQRHAWRNWRLPTERSRHLAWGTGRRPCLWLPLCLASCGAAGAAWIAAAPTSSVLRPGKRRARARTAWLGRNRTTPWPTWSASARLPSSISILHLLPRCPPPPRWRSLLSLRRPLSLNHKSKRSRLQSSRRLPVRCSSPQPAEILPCWNCGPLRRSRQTTRSHAVVSCSCALLPAGGRSTPKWQNTFKNRLDCNASLKTVSLGLMQSDLTTERVMTTLV